MALNRPDVFRAALPEAWREGGDAIYWVPQRTIQANRIEKFACLVARRQRIQAWVQNARHAFLNIAGEFLDIFYGVFGKLTGPTHA
jgi:hypothetical protein